MKILFLSLASQMITDIRAQEHFRIEGVIQERPAGPLENDHRIKELLSLTSGSLLTVSVLSESFYKKIIGTFQRRECHC